MPRTVLITGATGFSGSHLTEHYARLGWEVHGTYRDLDEDRSWLPDGVFLHHLDLLDAPPLIGLIREVQPDVVHHLAAQSSVAASWHDPIGTVTENAVAQYNLLEAVISGQPEARIVVVGSCDEYGDVAPAENPIAESHELRPASPYALSKVTQDLMAHQYVSRGLAVVRARPFLQVGPRRTSRFVAGSFARQIAEIEAGVREPRIEVGNIDLRRDFTDVRDVARAYAVLSDFGEVGEVYNISSGFARSLRDVLRAMLDGAGIQAEITQAPERTRPAEMPLLIGDSSRLRALTGWEPLIAFERSVSDTLAYWRTRVRESLVIEGKVD